MGAWRDWDWAETFSFVTFALIQMECYSDHPVQDVYARKLDVLNRGFSGYNTEWALPVLDQVRDIWPTSSDD